MATIEIIGALISLVYLRMEYKANIWLWPVGIISAVFYIYIFFVSKFYAITGINAYYLFACIYGWYCWKKNAQKESGSQIFRFPQFSLFPLFPLHLFWKLFLIFAVLFVLIAWILVTYTDSPVAYGDALTAALSIIALWMLAHRYAEQWLVWLVANSISAGLYLWMGLYPTSVLYIIYAIVSIFGFRNWKRMAANSE